MKKLLLVILLVLSGCNSKPELAISRENDYVDIERVEKMTEAEFIQAFDLEISDEDNELSELSITVEEFDEKDFSETSDYNSKKIIVTDPLGATSNTKVHYNIVESKNDIELKEKAKEEEQENKLIEKFGFDTNVDFTGSEFKEIDKYENSVTTNSIKTVDYCEENREVFDQYEKDIADGLNPIEPDNLYTNNCYKRSTIKVELSRKKGLSEKADDALMAQYIIKIINNEKLDDIFEFTIIVFDIEGDKYFKYLVKKDDVISIRDNKAEYLQLYNTYSFVTEYKVY